MRNKPKQSARSYALWLLGRQAYSAARLEQRLVRRGYSAEEAADAISYLLEIDYLNDRAYARNFVRNNVSAGKGPRRLRWELAKRGIDKALIDQALDFLDDQILFQEAERLTRRRLRGRQELDAKAKAKEFRYLMQRGYDYNIVNEVLRNVTRDLDTDPQNS